MVFKRKHKTPAGEIEKAIQMNNLVEKQWKTILSKAIIEAALAVELNPIKQELASFKTSETSKARLQLLN
ncbi:MAG: hypothetical protein EZS26_002948, partial [Candidatus Ordinivivax streblomastigis]